MRLPAPKQRGFARENPPALGVPAAETVGNETTVQTINPLIVYGGTAVYLFFTPLPTRSSI